MQLPQDRVKAIHRFILSVSSVGSEAMQPGLTAISIRSVRFFQYPRSDRRRCNKCYTQVRRGAVSLSVSSVGSEAMQLNEVLLYRSVWLTFQYPRSDRRRCNVALPFRQANPMNNFQYPRSDRRRCNPRGRASRIGRRQLSVSSVGSEAMQLVLAFGGNLDRELSVSSVGSEAMQRKLCGFTPNYDAAFSILGRIGGDATTFTLSQPPIHLIFQYPRSDRRRCNTAVGEILDRIAMLSVSSVGSEAMQLRMSPQLLLHTRLSVSSVGSEAMQRAVLRLPRHPLRPFSILGRIGGDATRRFGCSDA